MSEDKKRFSIVFPSEQLSELDALRRKLGERSVGAVVRILVELGLLWDEDGKLETHLKLMKDRKKHVF